MSPSVSRRRRSGPGPVVRVVGENVARVFMRDEISNTEAELPRFCRGVGNPGLSELLEVLPDGALDADAGSLRAEIEAEQGEVRYSQRLRPSQVQPGDPVERVVWYRARLGEDWVVSYRLVPKDGRHVIGEVRVYPYEEDGRAGEWSGDPESVKEGGLRSETLRRLGTERTLEKARLIFEGSGEFTDRFQERVLPRFGFDRGAATDVIPRAQRISLGELAQRVAKPHSDAKSRGESGVAAVSAAYRCSESYAYKRIRQAKDRGLLTDDGELTDPARELLESGDQPDSDQPIMSR